MLFESGFWSGVGVPAITGIITSGLVASVVQVIFKARYDQRLESHKGRLPAENGREIERIRAESTIAAERFKKSYGLLAERQAQAVEDMYRLLSEAYMALHNCAAPFRPVGAPTKEESLGEFFTARWNAQHHFMTKRLFFPSELSEQIEDLIGKMVEQGANFEVFAIYSSRENTDWDKLQDVWKQTRGPVHDTLRELEAKLRLLLQGGTI